MATLIRSDLEFILDQIAIADAHAAGTPLTSLIASPVLSFGLRTVDGTYNNLIAGNQNLGAADQLFPRSLDPAFRDDQDGDVFDPDGPGGFPAVTNTDYGVSGNVADADPRIISNLIVDQTANNPAAVDAAADRDGSVAFDHDNNPATPDLFIIPNRAPDEGLSAPFNSWMTFFGQFFDHGLDLVTKGGSGTVFVPLQLDDPLYNPASPQTNFMVLTRATNLPGPDGILGNADDIHEHENTTTAFVDQNQTYTSHPSHQAFLREYVLDANGSPLATGEMLDGADGGLPTWADIKTQAANLLGIQLTDHDVNNVPLLATDPYGRLILNPSTGRAQMVTAGNVLVDGNPAAPISTANALHTGHAFLNDIAHHAAPGTYDHDNNPATPKINQVADADPGTTDDGLASTYDNELLDRHFITGDGRGNENIGLTAVHHIFHSEHNRQVDAVKATVLATADPAFIAQWQLPNGEWNGERLFQAARFATEMQYQHLVFEEFARKIQPQIDIFVAPVGYDVTIDPSIVAEFAHTVYRFGHSMLPETVARMNADGTSNDIGLIQAFLNPIEFNQDGAVSADVAVGAIVRGLTRQVGNEIDEFVTDAVRNNLLGLPLDLPAINIMRGRDTGVPSLNAARTQFFAATGDSQLTPYDNWVDFAGNLKNESSIINFIAAYGMHESIVNATTLAGKRAAATAIVLGDAGAPADSVDFLNSTGDWATQETGLNLVDFWIGGLAEKILPFGGMLGSTFNFVFETQLENLQNGDRFYYLARTAGLNFINELEQNSFASLIKLNTDLGDSGAMHLPADIFSTPTYILEVDQTRQVTGLNEPGPDGIQGTADDVVGADGIDGNSDPRGGTALNPLVVRTATSLKYNGVDHVVLGGTNSNDTLTASIGDDTLWGDGGNDKLEGRAGNDLIEGGAGDDIITDSGGDDVIKGNAGNDVIHGGPGLNLIIGGDGSDFIITGEDSSEVFGGTGNDFILGTTFNEGMQGNEGDDWIEIGTQDGAPGDNFDPFGRDTVIGNDVFFGNGGFDEFVGEGGDDIMVGSPGQNRNEGMSGFDWVTYKNTPVGGVYADLNLLAFDETPLPPSFNTAIDRYAEVEGLSGSQYDDTLRGDDEDALTIPLAGAYGSVLTNIGLINGLQGLLGAGVTQFGSGNIILGGAGSDLIEGRGGDDLIDGDAWLNVRISVRANADGTGPEIASHNSMTTLQTAMLARTYNPGQLVIVREILATPSGTEVDTAAFSDVFENYDVTNNPDGTTTVAHTTVSAGLVSNGIDTLRNIERLQFVTAGDDGIVGTLDDGTNIIVIDPTVPNSPGTGTVTISDPTPTENQVLTATGLFSDPNGVNNATITFTWQMETAPNVWSDVGTGASFTPNDLVVGRALRVEARFDDNLNANEGPFYSDSTALVENVNDTPTGAPAIDDPTPSEDVELTATPGTIADDDGIAGATFTYQWQANGVNIAGATGTTFTPTQAHVGSTIRVVASYTDDHGTAETVTSAATAAVQNTNDAPTGAPTISDTTPTQGQLLTASTVGIADEDGLGVFTYQWQANDGLGGGFANIDGATAASFTPTAAQVGQPIRVVASYTDNQGTTEHVFSDATAAVVASVGVTLIGDANANTLTGTEFNDDLQGRAGNDTLNGLGGNDLLFGEGGNDTINAGLGDDVIRFTGAAGGFDAIDGGGGGADRIEALANGTVIGLSSIVGVEQITNNGFSNVRIQGSGAANTFNFAAVALTGIFSIDAGDGADTVTGSTGNDTILGAGGNDTLSGGDGNDIITGGTGKDTMTGGGDADIFDFNLTSESGVGSTLRDIITDFTPGVDKIDLSTIDASSAAGDQDFAFIGSSSFTGAAAVRVVTGTGTLAGYTQILVDTDDAGTGANMEILLAGAPSVTAADFLGAFVPPAGGGTFTGTAAAETLTGTAFDDVLIGLGGNDILDGLAGADTLVGGTGKDTMTGGGDADIFDFNLTSESGVGSTLRDIITDFAPGVDKIDLSTIDASSAAGDQAFAFIGSAAFSNTGIAELRAVVGTGTLAGYTQLLLDTDDAGTGANMEILLFGTPTVTAGDFML